MKPVIERAQALGLIRVDATAKQAWQKFPLVYITRKVADLLLAETGWTLAALKRKIDESGQPLSGTKARLNMDMIGRNDPRKIGIYASRPDLIDLSRELAREAGLTVELLEEGHAGSSDHAFFLEKGVSVIFYYDGGGDFAHKATDTWDQLSAEKMERVARLCFLTAWWLADQD
ncbi:MAG: M28 family peptidase [Candidatus Aminicenantales bacterium]